ncbi:MAG: C25 family cysteine peptidase [Clostridia bacterium]|nr:C25 family cysteine peptidase [Clostridia bacterium]
MKKVICFVVMFCMMITTIWVVSYAETPDGWIAVKNSFLFRGERYAPSVDVQMTNNLEYKIKVDIPGYFSHKEIAGKDSYVKVSLPGCEMQQEYGKPGVPIIPMTLEIPSDKVPEIIVNRKTEKTFKDLKLWPMQPHDSDEQGVYGRPTFEKDAKIYNTNDYFPKEVAGKLSVGFMRNHKVVQFNICPIRYNPVTRKMVVATDLDISVKLEDDLSDWEEDEPGLSSDEYDALMTPGTGKSHSQDAGAGLSKYMILMDDQFLSNTKLSEFIDWKKRKGNQVTIVKTSDIKASVKGAPTNNEIISFMRGMPSEQYPTYLLIIGDHTASNGVEGEKYTTKYGGYTDLSIACRTSTDYLPDLFVGRLPAKNNTELTAMMHRVLLMDRNPVDGDMYDKVLVAGQIQDEDKNNVADRLFCETADAIACYFEQDAGGIDYSCVRAIVNPHGMTAQGKWQQSYPILWKGATGAAAQIGTRVYNTFVTVPEARTRINNTVNNGVAIVQHRDHGSVTGWGDPKYTATDVNALRNGIKYPMVLSLNCLTGSYHQSGNFTQAWLTNPNGGAYSVVAATDVSYSGPNDWFSHGIYMGFLSDYAKWHNESKTPDWVGNLPAATNSLLAEGSAKRLGEMLYFGKMYMYQKFGVSTDTQRLFRLFHLFGDPEGYIQLHKPKALNVVHPAAVPLGAGTVQVDAGEDGVTVCLYNEDLGVHQMAKTINGTAVFDISPSNAGDIHVTVTGFGIRPYEGIIHAGGGNVTPPVYTSTPKPTDTPTNTPANAPTSTPTSIPSSPLVNLVKNSSATSYATGYTASKAIDGNMSTYWLAAAGKTTGQRLKIDLGEIIEYNQVVLKEPADMQRITSYVLQSSNDNATWTNIPGTTGTTVGTNKVIKFPDIQSRYVRLDIVTASADPAIAELEVYKVMTVVTPTPEPTSTPTPTTIPSPSSALVNLVKNASATSYTTGYTASKAIDGDLSTYWLSAAGKTTNQRLKIDLGKSITYNQVVIKEPAGMQRITSYVLQSSEDNITFTNIPGTQGTTVGINKVIKFLDIKSRYVRIEIVTASDSPAVAEFEVY